VKLAKAGKSRPIAALFQRQFQLMSTYKYLISAYDAMSTMEIKRFLNLAGYGFRPDDFFWQQVRASRESMLVSTDEIADYLPFSVSLPGRGDGFDGCRLVPEGRIEFHDQVITFRCSRKRGDVGRILEFSGNHLTQRGSNHVQGIHPILPAD
jgi:hypothetical protein